MAVRSVAIPGAIAQVGEFSFIPANLATSLRVMPAEAIHALVVAAMVSITLNPLLHRSVEPAVRWLERRRWVRPAVPEPQKDAGFEKARAMDHVVVVGYGPVGRTVSRILADNGIQPVVVEMNIDTVQRLKSEGVQAIYGDAAQPEILRVARLEDAAGLVISSPTAEAKSIIRAARDLNPKARILTRAMYLAESGPLRDAGADAIFSSEGEVALSMADYLMEQLGATDEQIQRERERVHRDLFRTA